MQRPRGRSTPSVFEEHEEASVAGAAGAGRRATDEYGAVGGKAGGVQIT